MTDKSGFIQKRLGFMFSLCDASSKMIPSSVLSRKRLFATTNKHESMLPPRGPARRRVQIPCEKLANFAKLLLLDSLQSPPKPRVFPGRGPTSHRLRQAPRHGRPGQQWTPAPITSQAAVTREGELRAERSGARIRINVLMLSGQGPHQPLCHLPLLTQHFPRSTVICGL